MRRVFPKTHNFSLDQIDVVCAYRETTNGLSEKSHSDLNKIANAMEKVSEYHMGRTNAGAGMTYIGQRGYDFNKVLTMLDRGLSKKLKETMDLISKNQTSSNLEMHQ